MVGGTLQGDAWGLLLSVVYVLVIVGVSEWLRRSRRVSFDLSRKIIHVGIGTWIVPTVLLFHTRYAAAAPPALFVIVNLLSLRGRWTRAMDAEAGSNVGTVLFPLSFVILLLSLWSAPGGKVAITAGLLSLAWGDAAAALAGKRWGRHRYRVGEGWRSLEGSAAMAVFSLAGILVAAALAGPARFGLAAAVAAALLATGLEAGSRRGVDNLLVPVGTAFFLWGIGLA